MIFHAPNGVLTVWQEEVFNILKEKHENYEVRYTTFDKNIEESRPDLVRWMPKYSCFVFEPGRGGHDDVVRIHRMTRRLNEDPFIDTFWGIITGYSIDDIKRVAAFNEPIKVAHAIETACSVDLNHLQSAVRFDDTKKEQVTIKTSKGIDTERTDYDSTARFVAEIARNQAQLITTSAHATERDWCMGYPDVKTNMILRVRDSVIDAHNLKKERFELFSDKPKVWLAAGNCLIGNVPVDTKVCMLNAMVHSLGVYQMVGYTVPTWFGEQGWGTYGTFFAHQGFYTLNESFHFANQDIIQKLLIENPNLVTENLESYDTKQLPKSIKALVQIDSKINQSIIGRLFDRDVVNFFGDPALEVRIKNTDKAYRVKQSFSELEVTLVLSKKSTESWPVHGLYIPFNYTLSEGKIREKLSNNSFYNQRFIYLSIEDLTADKIVLTFDVKPYQPYEAFSGIKPYTPKAFSIDPQLSAHVYSDFAARCHQVSIPRSKAIICSIEALDSAQLQFYAMFLYTRMPLEDMKKIDVKQVAESVLYAQKARENAPWRDQISEDLFLRYILPDWVLDEKRDPQRQFFYDKFSERAFACGTISDAVKYLNEAIFKELEVEYHATKRPKANQSAQESIEAHYASCSGLSIMLINACRAVGIPARMVGCPLWIDRSGNHNWVEFYDSQWIYEGASLTDPRRNDWVGEMVKNKTDVTKIEHTVWATTTEPQVKDYFIQVWNPQDKRFPAIAITEKYTDSRMLDVEIPSHYSTGTLWIYAHGEVVFSSKINHSAQLKVFLPLAMGPYEVIFVDKKGVHRLDNIQ